MPTRRIKARGMLQRGFTLNRAQVDEEARTVALSFSSETSEVERWFGFEILDHSPDSVRLERLSNRGPVLYLHDANQHLGVVEEVSIEQRKGRGVLRFGNSPLAEEKFQDVRDGILAHVSVGYRVHKMVLEQRSDDGSPDVYRAIDWEPYEISLLPVPADISVGVGRAAGEEFEIEVEEDAMPREEKNQGAPQEQTRAPSTPQMPAQPDVSAITNQVREQELRRIADLESIGARYRGYGGEELARQFIKEGKSATDLRQAILERLPVEDKAGSGEKPEARLDLSAGDLSNYSLLRALNALVEARKGDPRALENAAFEMECSEALAERMGRDPRGLYVPVDVMTRAMTASNNADLVPTEHLAGMFIESLRPNSVVMTLGATVMDGLEGNVDIPRELTNPVFGWIGDDDDALDSEGTTGSIKMAPKTLAGAVPMSRRLLKQSSPSVEAVIQRSMLLGAALGLDYGILAGSGTNNEPMGVFKLSGANVQTVATPGAPTWDELVGFETKVSSDNALRGSLGYVTTSSVTGNLKTTKKDAGSGRFLMEDSTANGYPVAISNQLAANRMAFGNWSDVLVGLWGIIDVNPDLATKAKSGGMVLRIFQDADVGVAHEESFCIDG